MKYQKAIEKVRQERLRNEQADAAMAGKEWSGLEIVQDQYDDSKVVAEKRAAAIVAPAAKNEPSGQWAPPVYSKSRHMQIDRVVALKNRVCLQADSPELDYYKVLRTRLMQRMQPMGWNTVMVTSVRPGEGKSLTSINLALVFAKTMNHTVLLVDCDMQRQSAYRYLGLSGDRGIVDYLANGHQLQDLIIWPGIEKMTVISGGGITDQSAELMQSPRMKDLMEELKGRFEDRFIIVDAPPILSGADTMALAPYVDAILLVVESGKTPQKEIANAMELIPKEKFMGFVLNKHLAAGNGYYSRYYNSKDKCL